MKQNSPQTTGQHFNRQEGIGSLMVILAGLLWGCTGLFVRYFTKLQLDTMQLTLFKVSVAGVLLLIYALCFDRAALRIRLRDLWIFLGSGLASMVFFTWCYYSTIRATSMSTAAVLLYLAPTLVMLMSAVFFKEKMTPVKITACLLAFAGCVFVSGIIGNGTALPLHAILTGLGSAVGYALYSIFGQTAMNRGYKPLTITTYTFLFATLGSLVFFRPSQIAAAAARSGSNFKFYGLMLLMSVSVSLLPYIFYTLGLSRTTPGKASIMASVEPVMATVLGLLVFGETLDVYGVIGIVLVILAVVLLNLRNLKNSRSNVQNVAERDNQNP